MPKSWVNETAIQVSTVSTVYHPFHSNGMYRIKLKLTIIFFLLFCISSIAQEVNIEKQLRLVENGNYQSAASDLEKLKEQNPDDPSVLYLDALLTKDGKEASGKYKIVSEIYPQSKYADAAVYQIYSYYYAAGNYTSADKYLDKLKTDYPSSSYLKMIENKNVDEKSLNASTVSDKSEKSVNRNNKELDRFTIQAGAFLVRSNAEKLQENFSNGGLISEIKEKKVGGSTFFVVNVGKFKTEDEAQGFLNVYIQSRKIDGIVVKIE
jgi:tetratricopeptide (TPR) repeat protein